MFYKTNDIYQVKVKESGQRYWLLKQGNEYKDFLYNNGLTINKSDVSVMKSFPEFLSENNLETMVLVQNNDSKFISRNLFIDILNMYSVMSAMTEEEYNEIDIISKTVGNMCLLTLIDNCKSFSYDMFKDKHEVLYSKRELLDMKSFENLLNQAIKLELIRNRYTDSEYSIGKEGLYIDYKISSILNSLGIKYNINDIKDFKINFDETFVEQYDENGRLCFSAQFNKNKTKTIDKKYN